MVDISKEKCERNAIEAILDNDRTLWLNKNHIEEGLDHKNSRETILTYLSNHR